MGYIMSANKGVREYQLIVNYFLTLDRSRGMTYGQLAMKYGIDKSNIHKRVRGVLNKRYYETSKNPKPKRSPAIDQDC